LNRVRFQGQKQHAFFLVWVEVEDSFLLTITKAQRKKAAQIKIAQKKLRRNLIPAEFFYEL